jgi:DNA-binding response OmpR family regulator
MLTVVAAGARVIWGPSIFSCASSRQTASYTKMVYRSALVVEDDFELRGFFCRALKLYKISSTECENGDEALASLNADSGRDPPDFALIDLSLRGKSGADLIKAIRGLPPPASQIKIILTSGHRDEVGRVAREVGADSHLVKPFTLDELCHLLRSWGILPST